MNDPQHPSDPDIERAVLCCLMVDARLLYEAPGLRPEHFYYSRHRAIARQIWALINDGLATDPLTVLQALRQSGKEEDAGGRDYLLEVSAAGALTTAYATHANTVIQLHARRELMQLAVDTHDAIRSAAQHSDAITAAQQAARLFLERAEETQSSRGYSTAHERVRLTREIISGRASTCAISTGWPDLDRYLDGGWCPGRLYVVAARPGMGKSNLALQTAAVAATKQREPTMFLSLEMSEIELQTRWISQAAGIGLTLLNRHTEDNPQLTPGQAQQCLTAMRHHADAPLYVADAEAIGRELPAIIARAHQCHRRHGPLGAIVIDYLQLIKNPSQSHRSREQEVADISGSLKQLAAQLHCAVIALAQLNRGPENRTHKRPQLSDLRESGAIEQDADLVALMFRESYYEQKNGIIKTEGEESGSSIRHLRRSKPDICEILLAKNRHGPTGIVNLLWEGDFVRFQSVSRR